MLQNATNQSKSNVELGYIDIWSTTYCTYQEDEYK